MKGSLRRGTRKIPKFTHLIVLVLSAAMMLLSRTSNLRAQTSERAKVAEGEYLSRENNPYGKQQTLLREIWVLWRISGGRYVVESELHFEKAADKPDIIDQTVSLSGDLRPLEMKTISRTTNPGYQVDVQLVGDEVRPSPRHVSRTFRVAFGRRIGAG